MKKIVGHRANSKPYEVKRTYNHNMGKGTKKMGEHCTHGSQSKKKK